MVLCGLSVQAYNRRAFCRLPNESRLSKVLHVQYFEQLVSTVRFAGFA